MSSFQSDTDAEASNNSNNGDVDDLLGIPSSALSSEDVPPFPHIPQMRASRGGIEDNKQHLVDVINNRNSLRQSEDTYPSDLDTSAEPGSGVPVKLYLAKEGAARHHDNTNTSPTAIRNENPGNNAPQTIASAILGRQQKLDAVTSNDDAQHSTTPVSSSKDSNTRPSNTGAFAIAGRGDETTNHTGESSQPISAAIDDSAITTTIENGNATTDMVHAEIAPDVEALVQQRLQTLQQEQHQIIVAVAATNDGNDNGNSIDDTPTPGFQWTTRNKVFVVIGMLLFAILIAVISGGLVVAVATQENIVPVPVGPNTPTNMPTGMIPSVVPTYGPTGLPTNMRQGIIEASLFGDGEDLIMPLDPSRHPEAFQWLLESDIWVPPPTATNPQGLWRERYFMVAFYFSTRGDLWSDRRNWLSPTSSICQWDCTSDICGDQVEIWCNEDDNLQHLTKRDNKMLGTIPSEIMALSMLERIDLSGNDLRGTLPSSIGLLSHLARIRMYDNDLSGSLPSELGNLVNLELLEIFRNALTGELPFEIGNWSSLRTISLHTNNCRGILPSSLQQWSSLEFLDISDNLFTGPLVDFGNWTKLQSLAVANCDLTGTIPTSIGSMTSLGVLVLDENQIAGGLPTELGLLTQLSFLNLGFNELSGNVPTELLHLSWLKVFDISYNQMTGVSPALPSNLTISCMDGNRFSDMPNTSTNTDDIDRCGGEF